MQEGRKGELSMKIFDKKYFKIVILFALCFILALTNESFLKISNIMNVLRQAAVLVVLGLGMTLVVISRGIDLSVAGVMSLSACFCATLLNMGIATPLSIAITLLIGVVFGFTNGVLTGYIGLPAFVATYGMSYIANGFSLILMNGNILYGFPDSFLFLGTGFVFGVVPVMVIYTLVLVFLFYVLLSRTNFGKQVYCVGANPQTSMYSGIKTKRILVMTFISSGVCASIAGIMLASRMNAAQSGIGDQYQMLAVAAVVMGGTSMSGGEGGIPGTVVGALILILIVNGMNLLGISSLAQSLVNGLVIVASVVLDMYVKNKSTGSINIEKSEESKKAG